MSGNYDYIKDLKKDLVSTLFFSSLRVIICEIRFNIVFVVVICKICLKIFCVVIVVNMISNFCLVIVVNQ